MPRRYSSSKARQAASRMKSAIRKYETAVRRRNQAVRAHNSRVRANQQRLRSELARLSRTTTSRKVIKVRVSAQVTPAGDNQCIAECLYRRGAGATTSPDHSRSGERPLARGGREIERTMQPRPGMRGGVIDFARIWVHHDGDVGSG